MIPSNEVHAVRRCQLLERFCCMVRVNGGAVVQIAGNVSGDLLGVAETRLANIFAALANFEHRPQVLEIIRTRPNSLPYLAAYVGAATNDRDHPLRYLQRYLSDQWQFKIPAPPTEDVASN